MYVVHSTIDKHVSSESTKRMITKIVCLRETLRCYKVRKGLKHIGKVVCMRVYVNVCTYICHVHVHACMCLGMIEYAL